MNHRCYCSQKKCNFHWWHVTHCIRDLSVWSSVYAKALISGWWREDVGHYFVNLGLRCETGCHFIRYIWLVIVLDPVLSSELHQFIVTWIQQGAWHNPERFGPYWHNITEFLKNPKMLCWIEVWWLFRQFECSELISIFKKPVWGNALWCYPAGSIHQQTGTSCS